MKQIIFKDKRENPNTFFAGILLDNGNVICGCCGGLFEASERDDEWELIKEYPEWINIEEAICGDDDDLLLLKNERTFT